MQKNISNEKEDSKLAQELAGLQQKVSELEAENKALEAFNYTVAHDLSGSLQIIEGYTECLLGTGVEKRDHKEDEYLQRITQASQQAKHLLNELLKFSKANHAVLEIAQIDLTGLAEALAAELCERNPERKVEFVVHPNMTVVGDQGLVRLMLMNLLNNAWKFSSKTRDAIIEMGSKEDDLGTVFFVRDNGVGFKREEAKKLFSVFYRHCGEEYAGAGIGLATVERIIQRHGGRVWAEGEPNKGATFCFVLPDLA